MKDMERQAFEDAWKDAFSKAETSPTENIWTNIELDLEKAEGEKMRRRLFYYKLTAAASITFALCVAGVGAYFFQDLNSKSGYVALRGNEGSADPSASQITTEIVGRVGDTMQDTQAIAQTDNSNKSDQGQSNDVMDHDMRTAAPFDRVGESKPHAKSNDGDAQEQFNKTENNNTALHAHNVLGDKINISEKGNDESVAFVNSSIIDSDDRLTIQKPSVHSLLASERIAFKAPQKEEVDPFLVMMAKLQQREIELREGKEPRKKNKQERAAQNIWASVGFAAGSFTSPNANVSGLESKIDQQDSRYNTTNGARSSYTSDVTKEVVRRQGKASGTAYSVGVNLGKSVSKHWVVLGGVNYLNQASSYETSLVSSAGKDDYNLYTLKEAAFAANNTTDVTTNTETSAPYGVNYSMEYMSIPLQAGYVIAPQRKLGIQVNTGISTEIFMKTVSRAVVNGEAQNVREGWSSDSPYRTVNFSGLLSAEISYRLGTHYSIGVNPGMRYPLSSIYKSEVGVKSMPLTMDIGMRFKYIFR